MLHYRREFGPSPAEARLAAHARPADWILARRVGGGLIRGRHAAGTRRMARAVIFLDRDGTLNVDKGFVHRAEDWEFTDRAAEALRELREAGYVIALVTNQSGVARGFFTLADVRALHEDVRQRLARQGVTLDAIAICPHAPDDDCECRKPRTGMARQIETQLGEPIPYERS